MAPRNVGRSIPSLKLEQVECHRELRRDHFSQNIFTFEKPLLPDFDYAVITPFVKWGVSIRHTATEEVPTRCA